MYVSIVTHLTQLTRSPPQPTCNPQKMAASLVVPVAFAAPVAPVARRARTVARATPFVGSTSAFAVRCACPLSPRRMFRGSTRARSALGASSDA